MSTTDWQIILLSALPVTELRATIPLALAMGMSPLRALTLGVFGNLLPIIPLICLLEPLSRRLRRYPVLDNFFQKVLTRTRQKGSGVQKYGALGLLLFVAVPLPGTGAWSGAILAWLLGIKPFYTFWALSGGVILAGLAVTMASLGLVKIADFLYDMEYLAGLLLLLGFIYLLYRKRKKKE
ncbi:MAG: COG2426 family protein [Bacillota bacterium]